MSDEIEKQLQAARRLLALKTARDDLLAYMRLRMPNTNAPWDVTQSRYQVTPLARILTEVVHKIDAGKLKRVAISVGPQFGKSDILSRAAPAWLSGRDPYRNIMLGSYNQDFANEFGGNVRDMIEMPFHRQIFPEHALKVKSVDHLETTVGGQLNFVGVGGSGTGKPADIFFIDDPIRNDDDAQSETYRERLWKWFNGVVFSRGHDGTAVVIVHCLTGDTRVLMADRTEKTLSEVRPGDRVLACEEGKFVERTVLNWASQGEDDVLDIRTGNNRVRANGKHPFAVMKDGEVMWVRADALKVGDIVLSAGLDESGTDRLTENEAWLLGFMFGDGWLTRRDTVQKHQSNGRTYPRRGWVTCAAHSKKEDCNAEFERRFADRFGFVPKRGKFGYWRTEKQEVGRWFAEHGLVGKAKTKTLPRWLFSQPPQVREAFVFGFHHADGTTDKKSTSVIAGANGALIRDIRTLARSCGFGVSNMHYWSGTAQPPNSPELVKCEIHSFSFGRRRVETAFRGVSVTKIEKSGKAEVFDLQVDGAENFIADGLVVHNTRWHQDDLIGRLCDPDHPERDGKYKGISKNWTYINLPAVVKDKKLADALGLRLDYPADDDVVEQFGSEPMTSLWPGRKSLPLLAEAKRQDARIFGALYMGEPTPEDGEFFKTEMLETYGVGELPSSLRVYGASDHAVSTKQMNDKTVLGCVGVDDKDTVWVLPDIVWGRMETDKTVENLVLQMQRHQPFTWWMESELISKSFGPFLRKRMAEERVYTHIQPVIPSKDKMTRARAIQGRMSMRRVKFPRYAPWWADAKAQLLKFPFGTHDDFVDWLSHVGLGLNKMLSAPVAANDDRTPNQSTLIGMLNKTRKEAAAGKRQAANAGW
jgi:predicted phage terminase large subunit-like protein